MSTDLWMLALEANLCTAEAIVNGIPVARVGPSAAPKTQRPIHEFLRPRKNEIQLVVEPGPTPSRALQAGSELTAAPQMTAALTLRHMPQGSYPEDPAVKRLLQIDFRPAPGSKISTPALLRGEADGPEWLPRWSWFDAKQISMSAAVVDNVARFLQQLGAALAQGNPEPYIEAARTRFEDNAAAYRGDANANRTTFRDQLKRRSADKQFLIEPVRRETLDLRLCGNNNVIDCVDAQWEPVLRAAKRPDGSIPLRYPTKVAFLGDRLAIVR
jgi:hypothetical protein